jgi:hypothetical protein
MAAQEQKAMVVILTIGYRSRCIALGCGNVARAILDDRKSSIVCLLASDGFCRR